MANRLNEKQLNLIAKANVTTTTTTTTTTSSSSSSCGVSISDNPSAKTISSSSSSTTTTTTTTIATPTNITATTATSECLSTVRSVGGDSSYASSLESSSSFSDNYLISLTNEDHKCNFPSITTGNCNSSKSSETESTMATSMVSASGGRDILERLTATSDDNGNHFAGLVYNQKQKQPDHNRRHYQQQRQTINDNDKQHEDDSHFVYQNNNNNGGGGGGGGGGGDDDKRQGDVANESATAIVAATDTSEEDECLVQFWHGKQCYSLVIDNHLTASDCCQLINLKFNLNIDQAIDSNCSYLFIRLSRFNGLQRIIENNEEVLPLYQSYLHLSAIFCFETGHRFDHFDFFGNPSSWFLPEMISFDSNSEFTPERVRQSERYKKSEREAMFTGDSNCLKMNQVSYQLNTGDGISFFVSGLASMAITGEMASQLSSNSYQPVQLSTETANEPNQSVSQSSTITITNISNHHHHHHHHHHHQQQQEHAKKLLNSHYLRCTNLSSSMAARCLNLNEYCIFWRQKSIATGQYQFCLINMAEAEFNWFLVESLHELNCWITMCRLLKYGVTELRKAYLQYKESVQSINNSITSSLRSLSFHSIPNSRSHSSAMDQQRFSDQRGSSMKSATGGNGSKTSSESVSLASSIASEEHDYNWKSSADRYHSTTRGKVRCNSIGCKPSTYSSSYSSCSSNSPPGTLTPKSCSSSPTRRGLSKQSISHHTHNYNNNNHHHQQHQRLNNHQHHYQYNSNLESDSYGSSDHGVNRSTFSDCNQLRAKCSSDSSEIYDEQCSMNNDQQQKYPWYYERLSREEAQELMQRFDMVDGVFLVRTSPKSPYSLVLSFISQRKVNHLKILTDDNCCLSLDWGQTKFYNLLQLIEFYQLNSGCLPTKLTHYLVNRNAIGTGTGSGIGNTATATANIANYSSSSSSSDARLTNDR